MKIIMRVKILLAFVLCLSAFHIKAQVLQKSAQKIRSYKNISYTDIVRIKFSFQDEFSADTLRSKLALASGNTVQKGFYLLNSSGRSYAFDGNKLVDLNLTDSTYSVQKESVNGQNTRTLLYWVQEIDKLTRLHAAKIKQLKDTIINNVAYTNICITESDTIEHGVRQYNATNFIIDKKSSLPIHIIRNMSGNADDGSIFGFIETHTYQDYRFDQKNFPDLSMAVIPDQFKLPVKKIPVQFLANGTVAPSITVTDFAGNKLELEKLKGKIVLINFSLIGCPHCVGAAQMLNRIYDTYKDKDVVILNIYPVDNQEAIAKFDKKENVRTPSYTSDRSVQKIYPYDGYPSFYLLDKNGLVAQSYNGFYKNLESELAEKINTLIR